MLSLSHQRFSFWLAILSLSVILGGTFNQAGLVAVAITLLFLVVASILLGLFGLFLYSTFKNSPGQTSRDGQHNFKAWIKSWIIQRVGEPPEAYWVVSIWFYTLLGSFFLFGANFGILYSSLSGAFGLSGGLYFHRFLPLPAVVGSLVILKFIRGRSPVKAFQTIVAIFLAISAALVAYVLQEFLLRLPVSLDLPLSGVIQVFAPHVLIIFVLSLSLWMAAAQHPPMGIGLKLFLIGLMSGSAISYTLAYPVFTWLYQRYIPNDYIWDAYHQQALLFFWTLSGVLAVISGPLTVFLLRPQKTLQKWWLGAVSGSIAGGMVYGYLGSVVSGVIAQSILLPIAVTREGFVGETWIFRLAVAINDIFPMSIAATWVCILAGFLLGGLTAILTPSRRFGPDQAPLPKFKQLLSELAWPGMILIVVLTFIVIVVTLQLLLGKLIPNILLHFGYVSLISPQISLTIITVQHFIIILVIQSFILAWAYQRVFPYYKKFKHIPGAKTRMSTLSTTLYVFIGAELGIILILWFLSPGIFIDPLFSFLALTSAVITLEQLLGAWETFGRKSEFKLNELEKDEANDFLERYPWYGVSLTVGFFVAVFSVQFVLISLSIILISVVLITNMQDVVAPLIGLEKLNSTTILPLVAITAWAFNLLLVAYEILSLSPRDGLVLPPAVEELAERPEPKKRFDLQAIIGQFFSKASLYRKPVAFVLLLIGIGGAFSTISLVVPLLCAGIATWLWLDDETLPRIREGVLLLAFLFCLGGLTGLAGIWDIPGPIDKGWIILLRLFFVLLCGPAFILMYHAVLFYTPARRRVGFRLVLLISLVCVYALLRYTSRPATIETGGIARYVDQSWVNFSNQNQLELAALSSQIPYTFYRDAQDNLWIATGTGGIAHHSNNQWVLYIDASSSDNLSARQLSGDLRPFFLEDRRGQVWIADGKIFGMIDDTGIATAEQPARTDLASAAITNDSTTSSLAKPTREDGSVLNFERPITGAAQSPNGDFWLITGDASALQFTPGETPQQAAWKSWSFAEAIIAVFADAQGGIWLGSRRGIYFLAGGQSIFSAFPDQASVERVTFFEEKTGKMWIGTNSGGYLFLPEQFTPLSTFRGWDNAMAATTFYQDSSETLWAGTNHGAYRLQGNDWEQMVPQVAVTKFIEDQEGGFWIGSTDGLYRLFGAGKVARYDASNSGVRDNWIRDLMVDRDGTLWVSAYTSKTAPSQLPWGLLASLAVFVALFIPTRRGYQRSPTTLGRKLARTVLAQPASLLPGIYESSRTGTDGGPVLNQLALYLDHGQDHAGAVVARAYITLNGFSEDNHGLDSAIQELETAAEREGADGLHRYFAIIRAMLEVRQALDIARLGLNVTSMGQDANLSIQFPVNLEAPLPTFLGQPLAKTWQSFAAVCLNLHKCTAVNLAPDRLGYLAQALESLENTLVLCAALPAPDGKLLREVCNRWRQLVRDEIEILSGRAEIRIDLLTRQIRRAETVTVAFRVHNTGQAVAENLVIRLQPAEAYLLTGEAAITLERLPSQRSEGVEFVIQPGSQERIRLICAVSWMDRAGASQQLDFADEVSFYSTATGFRRITNPYIVGHPLKNSNLFRGREDIFTFIKENLGGAVHDRTIVLHGQRRTGKTSILYQLQSGRLGADFVPVLVDMQEIAALVKNTADFLGELAYQIQRALRKIGLPLPDLDGSELTKNPVRVFNRFLDQLEDALESRVLVLMFDEFELIEEKIAEHAIEANLMEYFRSLMQHRQKLVFIFTGTHRLEEMSHDYWSILFNIALYRKVSFLSPAEARKLICEPVASMLDIDDLAVDKIYALTNGQPYFLQLICWALVDHCNNQQRNYATINDLNDVLVEILATGKAHFAYIWKQAERDEQMALSGVAHVIEPGKPWARPAEILELLETHHVSMTSRELIALLDRMVSREILENATDGLLRYRFQIELLRLWIEKNQSIAALVERGL